MSVTPPSSWPWLDHPVSGLRPPTESPCSDSLSLRLPYSVKLAGERKSLTHYTKGTPSPLLQAPSHYDRATVQLHSPPSSLLTGLALARSAIKGPGRGLKQGLRLFVCMRFQDLFHSPPGVLFAFPSRYWFTIGRSRVFSLGGWSPHLQTGCHVSRPTCLAPSSTLTSSVTGLSPTAAGLSRPFS